MIAHIFFSTDNMHPAVAQELGGSSQFVSFRSEEAMLEALDAIATYGRVDNAFGIVDDGITPIWPSDCEEW